MGAFAVILLLVTGLRVAVLADAGSGALTEFSPKSTIHAMQISNAKRKIEERRAWISDEHTEGPVFASLPSPTFWYMFTPYFYCPWTFEKHPSSSVLHEGGKWTCGLQEIATRRSTLPCIVYSFGSRGEYSFENHVHSVAPACAIHTFDPTSPPPQGPEAKFVTHHDVGLSCCKGDDCWEPFPTECLLQLMMRLEHSSVEILKIDIEGSEWSVLRHVEWSALRVGQILVEFHPQFRGPTTAASMNEIFSLLEDAGFYLASLEPSTMSNFGQVEAVFIHREWSPEIGMRELGTFSFLQT
jgi:Methyltransferase domain